MLGFRKDLLVTTRPESLPEDMPLLSGTKHKNRVLISDPKACSLLLKYSGITSDRKRVRDPNNLTQSEFKLLTNAICKSGFLPLADLLTHLHSTHSLKCPEEYRVFLSEIARNSPACGLLQPAGRNSGDEVTEVLKKITDNTLDIQDSRNSQQLSLL